MTDSLQRPRGRPRDAAKRDAILLAARELFLEHGADGVALDAVIARAGISRTNFYANFVDRASLLEAVIAREAERVVTDSARDDGDDGPIEDDLTRFGCRLLRLLTDPDILGFEHLIATAPRDRPDLPERFFEAGPGRARRALADRIARAGAAGDLVVDDALDAAEDLVGLWQGMLRVQLAMRSASPPTDKELRHRAERGTRQFLRLYGKCAMGG